jgi:hypothetical protein
MLRLWAEKHLDTLALARLQPDFSHDVPLPLAPPLQCHYRRGMAGRPLRPVRARGPVFPQHRSGLRPPQLPRLHGLWLYRPGEIHGDLYPLVHHPALYPFPRSRRLCPSLLRHRLYPVRRLLFHPRRHAQHRARRRDQIRHDDHRLHQHRRHCHVQPPPARSLPAVPDGWFNPFFGWHLHLDWHNIIDDANKKISRRRLLPVRHLLHDDALQRVFASLAGPAPNYDMQKILSTRPAGSQ